MRRNIPTNSDDIIDSRDVIARIEDLESEREALAGAVDEAEEGTDEATDAIIALQVWDESSDADELKALKALQDEAEGYCDWRRGATLIADSYFQTYAQQLADDIGVIDRNASWPLDCIDWERAADELKQDYTSVSFDGTDYWVGP